MIHNTVGKRRGYCAKNLSPWRRGLGDMTDRHSVSALYLVRFFGIRNFAFRGIPFPQLTDISRDSCSWIFVRIIFFTRVSSIFFLVIIVFINVWIFKRELIKKGNDSVPKIFQYLLYVYIYAYYYAYYYVHYFIYIIIMYIILYILLLCILFYYIIYYMYILCIYIYVYYYTYIILQHYVNFTT